MTSGRAKQEPQEFHGELRNWRGLGFMILREEGKRKRGILMEFFEFFFLDLLHDNLEMWETQEIGTMN